MATANYFREIADNCRGIPSDFGLREHTVTVVVTGTTSGLPWEGETATTTETRITVKGGKNPKVKFPSQKEIALGIMAQGQCSVGPFTPDYERGGIDRDLFNGSLVETGDKYQVRLNGPQCPNGMLYRIINCNVDKALQVTLTLGPVAP